jgi:hypothetical protein
MHTFVWSIPEVPVVLLRSNHVYMARKTVANGSQCQLVSPCAPSLHAHEIRVKLVASEEALELRCMFAHIFNGCGADIEMMRLAAKKLL